MVSKKLNICLHNIVLEDSATETVYDLAISQLETLIRTLKRLKDAGYLSSYEIFFDDGYESFRKIAERLDFGVENRFIHIAVITEQIGSKGKLNHTDLSWLDSEGFSIDSHGVSHAALATFSDGVLQNTPKGGEYRNMPYGKTNPLSEQEVLYQLKVSSKKLESTLLTQPVNFVLPYGLYNRSTIMIAASSTHYQRIFTCDAAFDGGQYLAPRLLITQENINSFESIVHGLQNDVGTLL